MKYSIDLSPSNPRFDKDLNDYKTVIDDAVKNFNLKESNTANKKSLRLVEVSENLLTLELESSQELPFPAKGLRMFSKYLIENSDLSEEAYYGSLFRSTRVNTLYAKPVLFDSEPADIAVMDRLVRLLTGAKDDRLPFFEAIGKILDAASEMSREEQLNFLKKIEEFAESFTAKQ